jgi:phasin family protein
MLSLSNDQPRLENPTMKANEMMNTWFENSKAAMAPARELGAITQRSFGRLTEHNMALTRDYMELSARSLQMLTNTRDPRAMVNEQVNLAKEMGDKLLANAEEYAKMATETQEELVTWAEKATEAAVAKAEETVGKTA